MKNAETKRESLEDYLKLQYQITLTPETEGGYVAEIKDLPGCITQGETLEEVKLNIEDARQLWIETAHKYGDRIPLPSTEVKYSGKIHVRMPSYLHRRLIEEAALEHISLNQYILSLLSQSERLRLGQSDPKLVDLRGADLKGTDLQSTDLRGANLSEADLSKANLSRANLRGVHLRNAKLIGTKLIEVKLEGANLIEVDLSGANLTGATLRRSVMRNADLSKANLSKTDLRSVTLSGARMIEADLSDADLNKAYLNKMSESNLSGADLSGADLSGANLSGADLSGADLSGANLSLANLSGVLVKEACMAKIIGLSNKERLNLEKLGAIFEQSCCEEP